MKLPLTAAEIESISDLKTAKQMLLMHAAMIEELMRQIGGLKTDVEEIKRQGKRQANPFSKGPPKTEARTPGQKAGHGYDHDSQRYNRHFRGLRQRRNVRSPIRSVDELIAVGRGRSLPCCEDSR